jgi:tellurite resistance protein TerC
MTPGPHEIIVFTLFLVFVFIVLGLDLGIFNRKSHAPSFKEALGWTIAWVALAFVFYLFLRFFGNELHTIRDKADLQSLISRFHHPISIANDDFRTAIGEYNRNLSLEFFTGYLIEYSLSVDNIFVILMIFLSFNIQSRYYHRVLFWGILGAIVMRFIFIFAASALIQRFEWVMYIFGGMLIIVGAKMGWEFFTAKDEDVIDTQNHPVVRFISRFFSVTKEDHGQKFWIRDNGKFFITPLFIVLVMVEFFDVVFAVDSVPAVFSVTRDPYIVFFSNIFAILGLRSLFFLVNNVMGRFHYLKLGLAFLLAYVGVKMIIQNLLDIHISTRASLGVIIGILAAFIILSLILPNKTKTA